MLLLLLSLILILPVLFGWGDLTEKILSFKICEGISGKIFSGIFALSIVFCCVAFFSGLNIHLETAVIAVGLFFFVKEKSYVQFSNFAKNSGVLFFAALLISIFAASFYPFILDHFGYYIPTIHWLSEFGLIKGISNLDLTLGQISGWHILQAGFSHFSDSFLRLNLILLIAYLIYIFENKAWIHLLFFPVFLFFIQSPSPDLPAYIFSLIILNEILTKADVKSGIFAFSIFSFTVKPTMIWLPLFVFIVLILKKKLSLKTLASSTIIFGFFLIKNLWIFGYPIFPLTIFDFNLNWKPNPDMMKMSSEYAVLKTYDAQYSLAQIKNFTLFQKIFNWFFLPGIKSFFNIGLVIFLIFYGIFAFIKKEKIHLILFFSLVLKSVLIISFSAQYRFFLEVFPVIMLAVLYSYNLKKISVILFSVGSFTALAFLINPTILKKIIPSFRLGNTMGRFEITQLYKPSEYQFKEFNQFKIGNTEVNVSKKYPFNFETPLPAISESFMFDYQRLGIFPQLKDSNDIRKGFVWKKLNAKEKAELNEAIKVIQNNYK
ncbi:LIC_10190 family membrane protein [Chryseobacterium sp.]|uniref:LIC_10190 family membrane protein n=1 Tax=Chryseobacterium sp. TaxID=1871047 RepID=UPI0028A25FF6|nr:hypothetical protein [Chryseobacterium sp.]